MGVFKTILKSIGVVILVGIAALMFMLSRNSDCQDLAAATDGAATMQAVLYSCYGGPEVLQVVTAEKPVPAENEILVKVKVAGVNPLDWHYMRGSPYFMRLGSGMGAPDDQRLGVDFSGTVEAVGSAVADFKPGDDVFGGAPGAFAEYMKVKASRSVVKKPANIPHEEAASVAIAALTALQGLRDEGALQAGQHVLINGASGGVGTFAVQIAKSMGAQVSGVCSTRNVPMVKSLGADHVFDYKQEDFIDSGQKFDLILDMVGNRSVLELRSVLKPEGRLVMVGGPSGNWLGPLKNILGALVVSPFVSQEMNMMMAKLDKEDLVTLAELMENGQLKPAIDRRYPLSDIAEAIRYSESGRARGKILINL